MADYDLLITTAVNGLAKSTDEARSTLYDRARNKLVGQLRGVEPPLSAQAITRELLALELAILKVEAKAAAHTHPQDRQHHKRPTDYYPYLVEGLNSLETSTDGARGALYDHVRNALAGQLRGVEPPLSAQAITRERLALEHALSKVEAEAIQRQREEEAKRRAEEQRRQREEAKRKAEEERRQHEEAKRRAKEETKRKAEEEHHRRQEEAKRKAEEERRRREEEVNRRVEEQRRQPEEDLKRKVEEERRAREDEAKRKAEGQRRQHEEEAKRKAEEERQSHVIPARRALAASPAPSLTPGAKPVYDITPGDENLPFLPLQQRALIKTLLAGLPQQTPAQLKASLRNYDDELRVRGVRPIRGLLKDMAEIIEEDLGAPNARREWLDEGMLKAFTRFAENHALFMKHFPLDPKREALYLSASVDEDNASQRALRKLFEDVANATLNANKLELTTDDLLKIVDKLTEFAKVTLTSITDEPAAESNVNPDNE